MTVVVQWLSLCKLTISRNPALAGSPAGVETALSSQFKPPFQRDATADTAHTDSVLVLYSSYPGDPTLLDYLRSALRDGMLSLAMLVTTFLQAVKSPEFHNASSLDILCRLVLNTHYASGLPPVRSVVASLESSAILSTVQDALWLLRIAHSLPPSHGHQLTASASELLMLLLSCARDIISQISTAQAMVIYADANDILQTMRLQADVRQILDEFIFSLSLHIGDDARIAREAQLIQSIHITAGKVDILETNSDSDIITCSLVLYHLVHRSVQYARMTV
jgi:mediator of RNA polymerase II transcription subunit 5